MKAVARRLQSLGRDAVGVIAVNAALFVLLFLVGEAACRTTGRGLPHRDTPCVGPSKVDGIRTRLPVAGCSTTFMGHRLQINGEGFRGSGRTAGDERRLRVAAIGDSFTFGWGVGEDETLPAYIERNLGASGVDARVYNLGVPGMNTEEEFLWLRLRAPELMPHGVVMQFLLDDVLRRGDATLGHPLLDRYLAWSHLYGAVSRRWLVPSYRTHVMDSYRRGSEIRTRWEATVRRLGEYCRVQLDAPLVIVVFPSFSLDFRHYPDTQLHQVVHDAVRDLPQVRIVEVKDTLPEAGPDYMLSGDSHPRSWVYAAIAPVVAKTLLGLVSRSRNTPPQGGPPTRVVGR